MRRFYVVAIFLGLVFTFTASPLCGDGPFSTGLSDLQDRIETCVNRAIGDGTIPGAVVLVGRADTVVYDRAHGKRSVVPEVEEMTRDTIFDLASLTKPIATATSIMILIDEGKLDLGDRLGTVLPEFDHHGKGEITIEQLLRHRSGLIADNPLGDYDHGKEDAWARLARLNMVSPPGENFLYSDVNYIILGRVVEQVSGVTLDVFSQRRIFDPLEMKDTGFRRISTTGRDGVKEDLTRLAPTERVQGQMLRGVVHDPRSWRLDGVAGHAGLFSTADDLRKFARMLLNNGKTRSGKEILKAETVHKMTSAADTPARQRRGLGWDVDTPFSSPRGKRFGDQSFGHTGFTGTSLWIDPQTDSYVILLTSRLHPEGKAPSPSRLRSEIATIAAETFLDIPQSQ